MSLLLGDCPGVLIQLEKGNPPKEKALPCRDWPRRPTKRAWTASTPSLPGPPLPPPQKPIYRRGNPRRRAEGAIEGANREARPGIGSCRVSSLCLRRRTARGWRPRGDGDTGGGGADLEGGEETRRRCAGGGEGVEEEDVLASASLAACAAPPARCVPPLCFVARLVVAGVDLI